MASHYFSKHPMLHARYISIRRPYMDTISMINMSKFEPKCHRILYKALSKSSNTKYELANDSISCVYQPATSRVSRSIPFWTLVSGNELDLHGETYCNCPGAGA